MSVEKICPQLRAVQEPVMECDTPGRMVQKAVSPDRAGVVWASGKGCGPLGVGNAKIVDCGGATIMPGLCEAHGHISYNNCAKLSEIGDVPPEEHTLLTAYNAKLLLGMGFTSVYSAASSKPRLEVAVRDEINSGRIPGPRFKAASPSGVGSFQNRVPAAGSGATGRTRESKP